MAIYHAFGESSWCADTCLVGIPRATRTVASPNSVAVSEVGAQADVVVAGGVGAQRGDLAPGPRAACFAFEAGLALIGGIVPPAQVDLAGGDGSGHQIGGGCRHGIRCGGGGFVGIPRAEGTIPWTTRCRLNVSPYTVIVEGIRRQPSVTVISGIGPNFGNLAPAT